jgi:hypothetical protein
MAKQMTDQNTSPTHQQISQRAYEIFIERGQPQGHDLDHWLEAEAQLRAPTQASGATIRTTQSNGRSQNGSRPQARARK